MGNIYFSFIAITIAFVSLILFSIALLKKRPFDSKSITEKFFRILDQKFKLGLITEKKDIVVLAESFRRDRGASYDLVFLLEDYLVYLIKKCNTTEDQVDKRSIIEIHQKIQTILDAENEEKPYSDLPKEERRIFRSLNNSTQNNNKEAVNEDLEDLRILLTTRNKIYTRSSKLNRWSIPLAIFGLVATLYFGIRSINSEVNSEKIQQIISNIQVDVNKN